MDVGFVKNHVHGSLKNSKMKKELKFLKNE